MINGIILKKFDAFNETIMELKSLGREAVDPCVKI